MSKLDLSIQDLDHVTSAMGKFSRDFLAELPTAPAYCQVRPAFASTIRADDQGQSLGDVLDALQGPLLRSGIDTTSGRFFGYVPGGGIPMAAVADFVAALSNRYSGMYDASPAAAEVENATVKWLLDVVGYSANSAWGALLSGGTLSTLTAIVAARRRLAPADWARAVVYVTEHTHHVIGRCLKIAGIGEIATTRRVPLDARYRMDTAALEAMLREDTAADLVPWVVFSTAGTTSTGAVDEIEVINSLARQFGFWHHVDAAYGGFFKLSPRAAGLFSGLEQADSVVVDPHKGLFMPYGCGAVLVKDGENLRRSFQHDHAILDGISSETAKSPSDYSPELTRPFRALRIWLSLKVLGQGAFVHEIDEKLRLAQTAHEMLKGMDDVEVGRAPDLSTVIFRFRTNEDTDRALAEIRRRGKVYLSSTVLGDKKFLRICVMSFRTSEQDVATCIDEIARAARSLK